MFTPDLAESLNRANSFLRGDSTARVRVPLVFQCSFYDRGGIPPIALRVNPHVISWKQGKRMTRKNTAGGTAFFHWTDRDGRSNDLLELDFRGRTGNILNRPSPKSTDFIAVELLQKAANYLGNLGPGSVTDNPGAAKHYVWSRLYQLTRERMVDVDTGDRNIFQILYRSPILPAPVLFTGFFSKVMDFSETAESPHMLEYSMTFTVQDSQPSLDYLSNYLSTVLATPQILETLLQNQAAATKKIEDDEASMLKQNVSGG